jgi:hypothetical protein
VKIPTRKVLILDSCGRLLLGCRAALMRQGAWREAAETTHLSAAVEFTFAGFGGARQREKCNLS